MFGFTAFGFRVHVKGSDFTEHGEGSGVRVYGLKVQDSIRSYCLSFRIHGLTLCAKVLWVSKQ